VEPVEFSRTKGESVRNKN